ncbi:FadR/GntR family transcriptional regulator [Actinomadura bangladeshensis]|uniref:FadR family transcriptional regulator n=1 Tax=Actinomadura bangladeshensis TaxID=453573 RepID=A0A4R4NUJ2_9ACTN|nr:FadR/GntR family transcriptional regulator [Actinomadura bangladeshensis]TDC11753.1 FadR family transcriptional regulator [Actinomadura bangladeshensis]
MVDNPQAGLHGSVLDRLGALITSGELGAGEVLRIEQLEERFGVSRSVVREAIRVLESMGMVTSRRRVGVTVAERARWNVFDPQIIGWRLDGAGRDEQLRSLGELRRGLEPVAAALAARRATPAQCGALTGAVMEMAVHGRSGDLESYLTADILFHRTLLEASGNEMMAALSGVVAAVLAGRTHHHLMPAHPEPAAIRWHAEVAQAVQAGDADAAERAMRDIVDEATRAMLDGGELNADRTSGGQNSVGGSAGTGSGSGSTSGA